MENKSIVLKTLEYIEDNLEKDLNLEEISEKMYYSKFHLNRIFSEKVGCTIYKYIQQRRLTESAKKLIETDKPILDIALEAGYNSQQSFTLAFKQIYLYPPQTYRLMGVFKPKQNRVTIHSSANYSNVNKLWEVKAA